MPITLYGAGLTSGNYGQRLHRAHSDTHPADLAIERHFRDSRETTIGEGTTELQLRIICKELGVQ